MAVSINLMASVWHLSNKIFNTISKNICNRETRLSLKCTNVTPTVTQKIVILVLSAEIKTPVLIHLFYRVEELRILYYCTLCT